jgi:hypothetical protein
VVLHSIGSSHRGLSPHSVHAHAGRTQAVQLARPARASVVALEVNRAPCSNETPSCGPRS